MPRVIVSPEIVTRNQFGWLLQRRNLWGTAVEIGKNRAIRPMDRYESWEIQPVGLPGKGATDAVAG